MPFWSNKIIKLLIVFLFYIWEGKIRALIIKMALKCEGFRVLIKKEFIGTSVTVWHNRPLTSLHLHLPPSAVLSVMLCCVVDLCVGLARGAEEWWDGWRVQSLNRIAEIELVSLGAVEFHETYILPSFFFLPPALALPAPPAVPPAVISLIHLCLSFSSRSLLPSRKWEFCHPFCALMTFQKLGYFCGTHTKKLFTAWCQAVLLLLLQDFHRKVFSE